MDAVGDELAHYLWPGWPYLPAYAGTGAAAAALAQAPVELALSRLAPERHVLLADRFGHRMIAPATATASMSNVRTTMTTTTKTMTPGSGSGIRAAATIAAPAALRFAAFGQLLRIRRLKRAAGTDRWPRWLDVAAAGAGAGAIEAVVVNRVRRPLATPFALASPLLLLRHPAKLFCCFGTFGWLSEGGSGSERSRGTVDHLGADSRRADDGSIPLDSGPADYSKTPFWQTWLRGAAAGAVGSGIMGAAEGLRGAYLLASVVPRGALGIGTLIAVQVTACDAVLRRYDI